MLHLSNQSLATSCLLKHFWFMYNYEKLIEMQANQTSFAHVQSRAATIRTGYKTASCATVTKVNTMNKAKIKVYGRSGK